MDSICRAAWKMVSSGNLAVTAFLASNKSLGQTWEYADNLKRRIPESIQLSNARISRQISNEICTKFKKVNESSSLLRF
ncbi:MAG TPA: hypothetical protein DDW52_10580 [Planctomycetaceae bacterium]|nr:hypothetical protein [Planctomycetaceae bacterium]